jgi:hypothetical protein
MTLEQFHQDIVGKERELEAAAIKTVMVLLMTECNSYILTEDDGSKWVSSYSVDGTYPRKLFLIQPSVYSRMRDEGLLLIDSLTQKAIDQIRPTVNRYWELMRGAPV